LGTVVVFLVFVWLTANLFLFGAELTRRLPDETGEPDPDGEPFLRRVAGGIRGLALHPPGRRRKEG
jgi:uncharacterized BrkB/YihY/UPF0761 family membrane protein